MTPPTVSQRTLRVGIVGCGLMGRKHALNCCRMEGVSVVAVADVGTAKAEALATEVRATRYDSAEEMIAKVPLDAAILATPPGERMEIVEAATAARIPLFVEKPLAIDISTANAYRVAAQKAAVTNAVGFQLRYSPLTQQARDLISGRQVTHVRTACTTSYYLTMDMPLWYLQREHSGGPFLEQSLHMIDMARYLVGDITHVFARGNRLVCPNLDRFDSEDTLIMSYQFANGALGTDIDSSATLEFNWEVELFGPDWRLLIDYARKRLRGHIGEKIIDMEMPDLDLHMLEMQAFLSAVRNGKRDLLLPDFADATRTLAVLLAADRSLKTGAWEPVTQ